MRTKPLRLLLSAIVVALSMVCLQGCQKGTVENPASEKSGLRSSNNGNGDGSPSTNKPVVNGIDVSFVSATSAG